MGPVIDLYSGLVQSSGPLDMGRYHLTAGKHEVRFQAVSKNNDSTGFNFGIDRLDLVKVR